MSFSGKVIPNAVEVERSLLGGIMVNEDAMEKVIAFGLKRDDFYAKAHRTIWDAVVELHREKQPIDVMTVCDRLTLNEQLSEIGGTSLLGNLVDCGIECPDFEKYCAIIRGKAALRRIVKLGQDMTTQAMAEDAEPENIVEHCRVNIREIVESWLGDANDELTPLAELAAVAYQDIEEAVENRDNPDWRGEIKSGFTDLDKLCVGFSPKDLIVVGGRSGMGKTTFMQNLAVNIANQYGPVLSFHFGELDKSLIAKRIISQQSGVGLKHLRSGHLMPEDFSAVLQGIERMGTIPLSIDDRPRDMNSVRDAIERWQTRYDQTPRAIFLDYVQIIRGPKGSSVERLESIMQEAKYLAGDFNCPVFVGSQINRGTEDKMNKRPSLAELKGCGGIEEKAQHVLLLYRDAYYNRESDEPNVTEVDVAKCTNGEPGLVKLYSAMETFNFGNLAK